VQGFTVKKSCVIAKVKDRLIHLDFINLRLSMRSGRDKQRSYEYHGEIGRDLRVNKAQ
jgi:hypothetical protein